MDRVPARSKTAPPRQHYGSSIFQQMRWLGGTYVCRPNGRIHFPSHGSAGSGFTLRPINPPEINAILLQRVQHHVIDRLHDDLVHNRKVDGHLLGGVKSECMSLSWSDPMGIVQMESHSQSPMSENGQETRVVVRGLRLFKIKPRIPTGTGPIILSVPIHVQDKHVTTLFVLCHLMK